MSDITIKMPIKDGRHKKEYSFRWLRNKDGVGRWLTLSKIGMIPANCYIHLELERMITLEAKKRGLSEIHNFSTIPPKYEEESSPKERKEKKSSSRKKRVAKVTQGTKLVGGFNPFI